MCVCVCVGMCKDHGCKLLLRGFSDTLDHGKVNFDP